jgi:multidrug efflux system membrane fusion protein
MNPPVESKRLPVRRWPRAALWTGVLIVILAVGAYVFWPRAHASARTNSSQPGGGNPGKGGKSADKAGAEATPVVAVRARKGNIGIYFTGLGAVTPLQTVTVHSRVDGELMKVLYKEGDMVRSGDELMDIDPRPYQAQLTQFEGQLARDQAALDNARTDLARYELLIKTKAVPEQQLATQRATVEQDQGIVKADQGQIDAVKLNLVYCKITAPITGRVGLRLVDAGNIVHASDANGLVVITQIDPMSVIFTVAEDQLPQVLDKIRAKQTLTVEAWDRQMVHKIAQGTLATVDNQIDQSTATVRLRAVFDNGNGILFPNQFVNAKLLLQEKRGVVLLSSAALQRTANSVFVYLVKPDSTVEVRNVMVGAVDGDDSEITSGLAPGDVVVMTGADRLQEGSRVNVQIAGEQPQAGKGRGQ